jgi:hypothetical protein
MNQVIQLQYGSRGGLEVLRKLADAGRFARISAELLEPMAAVVEGKLTAQGDFQRLNGLTEMFGGRTQY